MKIAKEAEQATFKMATETYKMTEESLRNLTETYHLKEEEIEQAKNLIQLEQKLQKEKKGYPHRKINFFPVYIKTHPNESFVGFFL